MSLELAIFVFTSKTGKRHAATHIEWIPKGEDSFQARGWLFCENEPLEGVADFLGFREGRSIDCKNCLVKLHKRVRVFMNLVGIEERGMRHDE